MYYGGTRFVVTQVCMRISGLSYISYELLSLCCLTYSNFIWNYFFFINLKFFFLTWKEKVRGNLRKTTQNKRNHKTNDGKITELKLGRVEKFLRSFLTLVTKIWKPCLYNFLGVVTVFWTIATAYHECFVSLWRITWNRFQIKVYWVIANVAKKITWAWVFFFLWIA